MLTVNKRKNAKKIFWLVGLLLLVLWLFREKLSKLISEQTGELIDVVQHKTESVLVVAAVVLSVVIAVMLLPLITKLIVITAALIVGAYLISKMRKSRKEREQIKPPFKKVTTSVQQASELRTVSI